MIVDVLHVRAFSDNYIWFAVGTGNNSYLPCIIVDPGDADAAKDGLNRHGLSPVAIFCTHHHGDHVGGVRELVGQFDLPVYGPANESIRNITHPLSGGETLAIDGIGEFQVLATPGHTPGHISYLGGNALFCGDTLFMGGCGRLLGGTAAQLHRSLQSLGSLPADTRVYCAHEYTLANLAFAKTVEPANPDIAEEITRCRRIRKQGQPTLPSTIGLEKRINPFLRTARETVRAAVIEQTGESPETELAVFAALRRWKDGFTG